MSKAHLTAIGRKAPSLPMRRLSEDGLLVGDMLDFGCGRGYDAQTFGMESYDPHYKPEMPTGRFDTVTCNFVLNVIEDVETRRQVLRDISAKLKPGGTAYITVRNDKSRLCGTTGKGTWQGEIALDLPVVYKCAGYVTYEFRAGDESCQMSKVIHPRKVA